MQSGRRPARAALHFGERQRPDLERWVKVPSGSEAARRRGDLTSKALYLYLFDVPVPLFLPRPATSSLWSV